MYLFHDGDQEANSATEVSEEQLAALAAMTGLELPTEGRELDAAQFMTAVAGWTPSKVCAQDIDPDVLIDLLTALEKLSANAEKTVHYIPI